MPEHRPNGNPYADPKMVRGLFQSVRLSREQRQRHRQRLERRFRPSTPASDRANQLREFAAIGLLLVAAVFVVWAWNALLGVQDSDPPDVADVVATATPDPQPASTPAVEGAAEPTPTPTAAPVSEPAEAVESQCTPGDVSQVLADFVGAFNAGNFDRLRELLPDEPYEHAPS